MTVLFGDTRKDALVNKWMYMGIGAAIGIFVIPMVLSAVKK